MPDYATVEWSPTRQAAIVRLTVDEVPPDECDEAAHQILACGNLARRMNTPPAKRPLTDNPVGEVTTVTVASTGPFNDAGDNRCKCSHFPTNHSIKVGGGRGGCHVIECGCQGFVSDA